MARRTPGLQARSQVHSYWGQFQYDTSVPPATFAGRTGDVGSTLLPNASVASALAPSEYAKLEAGDTAATIDTTVVVDGAEFGLWTCISPGTVGVGNAVWVRMDNASLAQQTIRDAHRIVVGIPGATTGVPATDTLLNLSPYVAGVSADFIDPGDGAGLALALATAAAIGSVDVRIVSGLIDLAFGAVATPLTIPQGCRLIGAGSSQTKISGHNNAEQGIFSLAASASLEGVRLSSPAPISSPGTAQGVVQATGISAGNFSLRDVTISLVDDAARVAKAGVYAIAAGSGGTKSCKLDDVTVVVTGTVAATEGISLEGYVRSTVSNCTVSGSTTGIRFSSGIAPLFGNEAGEITNFKGFEILEKGILIETLLGATPFYGVSVSDSYVSFSDADVSPQDQTAIQFYSQGTIDQANVTGVQAHWGANAATVSRIFGKVSTTQTGALATGISFFGCGATRAAPGFAAGITRGLVLDASDADSIQGSDLGCDFAGAGPLPAADIIVYNGASALWEHAHPRGLA